ncbi:unnamed protein product [Ectocarpus sp. 8 AP-2014]
MVVDINVSIWRWRFCERFLLWPVSPRSDRSVSLLLGAPFAACLFRFHVRFHVCRGGEEGVQCKSFVFQGERFCINVAVTQSTAVFVVVVVVVVVWCLYFSSCVMWVRSGGQSVCCIAPFVRNVYSPSNPVGNC